MCDWVEVYDNNSEEKIACYSLDSVSTLEAKLAKMKDDIGIECILTGFSGGSRYQPVVRYQKVRAYVDDTNLEKAIDYLGLKKVETGANVVAVVPYIIMKTVAMGRGKAKDAYEQDNALLCKI